MAERLHRPEEAAMEGTWFNEGYRGSFEPTPSQPSEPMQNTDRGNTEISALFANSQSTERTYQGANNYDQFDIIASERMAAGE